MPPRIAAKIRGSGARWHKADPKIFVGRPRLELGTFGLKTQNEPEASDASPENILDRDTRDDAKKHDGSPLTHPKDSHGDPLAHALAHALRAAADAGQWGLVRELADTIAGIRKGPTQEKAPDVRGAPDVVVPFRRS